MFFITTNVDTCQNRLAFSTSLISMGQKMWNLCAKSFCQYFLIKQTLDRFYLSKVFNFNFHFLFNRSGNSFLEVKFLFTDKIKTCDSVIQNFTISLQYWGWKYNKKMCPNSFLSLLMIEYIFCIIWKQTAILNFFLSSISQTFIKTKRI